jgi:hypothetical protein
MDDCNDYEVYRVMDLDGFVPTSELFGFWNFFRELCAIVLQLGLQ